ncbi:hypothetical protein Vadar_024449 [Vaccinium darrowii]|uniref:Uncharacterized protein n=1 Tax=Vaccinium darrowii TaxID=229202 RepID=A0ACB7ZEG1_9ERIC|nr:hypothetical protein Vadar_024449 [Vaccinium darrowii]
MDQDQGCSDLGISKNHSGDSDEDHDDSDNDDEFYFLRRRRLSTAASLQNSTHLGVLPLTESTLLREKSDECPTDFCFDRV